MINRTHYLGELRSSDIDKEVRLYGWVKKHRDLGELIFIDLGDISGITQLVVSNSNVELFEGAKKLKSEYCVEVIGTVKGRQDVNSKIATGEIEVIVSAISLINDCEVLPFMLEDDPKTSEETRLTHRFLDLRRKKMQENLKTRHKITSSFRRYLDNLEFIDIETPILTKATPEGARDYLVPSRVNQGQFYALPQSPQIYKNLLMVAGLDRYYQIVKCFRDEDLRSDRQPEFTQLDIEMSFMNEQQIMAMMETMMKQMLSDVLDVNIQEDFIVMDYDDAMNLYGVDKPDLRFEMKINDLTNVFKNSEFNAFKTAENVRCLVVKDAADKYSRKDLDKLELLAKKHHAKAMAYLKVDQDQIVGPLVKFFNDTEISDLHSNLDLSHNDLILIVADGYDSVCSSLGALRCHLGEELGLIDESVFKFAWIINWPMFEYDSELDRYFAMHHPFTMPVGGNFSGEAKNVRAIAYDLVLNGYEIGGGSIRINNPKLQMEMFNILGLEKEEITEKFGFLLEAYKYGAPYHGGIAFGVDRIAMILSKSDSIRDVIAFPKNNRAQEMMISSPSSVSQEQLDELAIKNVEIK